MPRANMKKVMEIPIPLPPLEIQKKIVERIEKMMAKIDTPWWKRNPYILSDDTWGIIYVAHGAASVALITLIMAHLYFAARPDKRWITLSMLRGWISRERYLEHYSQGRWPAGGSTSAATAASAAKQSEAGSQRAGAS